MFITKKHISRRTVLKGSGVTLALPLLEAMIPASTALAETAAMPKPRFVGCFVPHGMAPGTIGCRAKRDPSTPALPFNWKPLEPFRDRTVIISGLHCRSAEPPPGATGADHWVAAMIPVRGEAQEDRRAPIYERENNRSDDRGKDRPG